MKKKKELEDAEETFNREYLDRIEAGGARPSLLRRMGIVTTADYALGLFYLSYIFLGLIALIYIALYSSTKIKGLLTAGLGFTVLGLLMTGVLLRFA